MCGDSISYLCFFFFINSLMQTEFVQFCCIFAYNLRTKIEYYKILCFIREKACLPTLVSLRLILRSNKYWKFYCPSKRSRGFGPSRFNRHTDNTRSCCSLTTTNISVLNVVPKWISPKTAKPAAKTTPKTATHSVRPKRIRNNILGRV